MSPWSLKIATPVINPIPKNSQELCARIGCNATLTYCAPVVGSPEPGTRDLQGNLEIQDISMLLKSNKSKKFN